jgi:ubiquinol-cytochrome c reductase cytochrome b subunit
MESQGLAAQTKKKGVLDPIIAILRWAWERLERTIFLGWKFVFPSRFISPLGFLGMLTTVVFIIRGVTGALLMFH